MASLQATADSIRANISSSSTCTPMTVTLLGELLLPKSDGRKPSASTGSKENTKAPTVSKTKLKAAPLKGRAKKVVDQEHRQEHEEQLSAKERSILATEVINATLKSLTGAIKAPPQGPVRRQASSRDLMKTSARKTLRRSNSLPQSPLQPRSLNRVSSSPSISTRHNRSSSSVSISISGHRATGECARVAFACLRTLQASKITGIDLPPLQLENGMSVLIGKLLSLGLDDLAIKEIRILKRRLNLEDAPKKPPLSKALVPATAQTLSELLDFGKSAFSGAKLGLVITTQLQILRLMASSRKYSHIEAALPLLAPEHSSSPSRLLLRAAKEAKEPKPREKVARQFQTLSETLFSLCPSVASSDDALALEPRLSICPEIAIEMQTLAIHNRLFWWNIAGHRGDTAKDIFDPFLRCLSTFARRSQSGALEIYQISSTALKDIQNVLSEFKIPEAGGHQPSLSAIYRLLGSLSKEAGVIGDAIGWMEKVQTLLDPKTDSEARRCTVIARLVSLYLRKVSRDPKEEELLVTLLEGLERPFKGEVSEIDDLVTEVAYARRAANALLAKGRAASPNVVLSEGLQEMCESLVFLCPRLSLRYLGSPPDVDSSTREIVRHDQRRQLITMSALHSIDSTLFLIKNISGEGRLAWDLLDSKLQDCLLLHNRLDVTSRGVLMEDGTPPPAYYVRISNLYYSQFLDMQRNLDNSEDGRQIRSLRRAIDCMQGRPQHEKKAAFLSKKLERMAEFYKKSGRFDDLFKTLSSLRDELIEQGVLSTVIEAAATQPICSSWLLDDETSILARTVQSLVKVQLKFLSSSGRISLVDVAWSDGEKAAILENQLVLLSNQSNSSNAISNLLVRVLQELLCLYGLENYPIRRLRVLLQLFALNPNQCQEVLRSLEGELTPYCNEEIVVEGSSDEGLQNYLANFKALATTCLELRQEQPNINTLKQGLATWTMMRRSCNNAADLERQVEDVDDLLTHLQSIGDYMQMKGQETIRLAVLRLIAEFNQLLDNSSNADSLVLSFAQLGTQWLQLGYSGRARMAFDEAKGYNHQNGVTLNTSLQLHISYSEYLLAVGNHDKSEEQLICAQILYSKEGASPSKTASMLEQRTRKNLLISKAYLIHSMLALERGAAQVALNHAKQGIRLLRRAWTNTEEQFKSRNSAPGSSTPEETDKIADELSQMSVKTISVPTNGGTSWAASGASFWPLIAPLFRSLNYLSSLYAHHGMFQETLYYAQEAHKLVNELGSDELLAMASALLGSIWLKAGTLDRGSELLIMANQYSLPGNRTRDSATLAYYTGSMRGLLGDHEAEVASYEEAEDILKSVASAEYIENIDKVLDPTNTIEEGMAKLSISKRKVTATRKASVRSKTVVKRKTATPPKSPVEVIQPVVEVCQQLGSLKAAIIRQKARALMSLKKSADAMNLLRESDNYASSHIETIDQGLAMARQLLLQSMEQMAADPVYSVLQDSTISFPSVVGLGRFGERLSVVKASPPKKNTKNGRDRTSSRSPAPDSFFDKLHQAQEYLTEIHSLAIAVAPLAVIHNVSALLNTVAILLSASGQMKGKQVAHPGFASCSIETARTIALRRQRKVLHAELSIPLKVDDNCWPVVTSSDSRRPSTGFSSDMSRFQQYYIDIIPKSWTAISISLSDSRNELSITKLQAGHSPFVLRLPLGRHNSMDADEEVFGFEQGQAELLEIIQLANESAHDARDITSKDAKTAWWEEREALDARLRDLLENIEKVWLGGFTGIFSQHTRRADLLARFQKYVQNILDKHLPSRRKSGKRGASQRIALDPRILELFIGLGDASDEDCDFSEPLTDLLYFVVDVLQFHGELNAYAEIDFDSIVVEMHDALRGYHTAVNASGGTNEGRHTILILDKALYSFPWESLPCMYGLAVSRLPSLGCLRDRIIKLREVAPEEGPEGQYINRNNGSYILNPSGDLKNTQATFQKSLQSLNEWNGIIKRVPSEEEIKSSLGSKDLYLYFGHGSGAQYIRAKELRKLDKCAVTWLMGCSSGAVTEVGEFEPYGPPINYMHAGCPALVATLWDVTDKDIDRFAKTTFEHWGLFEKEMTSKVRGKKRTEVAEDQQIMSLVEAVAKGRAACNLRYLNAAAVCVYGVPVYFR